MRCGEWGKIMRWTVIAAALASGVFPGVTFAQTGTSVTEICYTRSSTSADKSARFSVDGASRDLGDVKSIKIITLGTVTIVEADNSVGYTDTYLSEGRRLDLILHQFKPELCPPTNK
jgi:hypothetical protein